MSLPIAKTGAFQKQLGFGQIAETDIARWLISRSNMVLPVYDIEYDTGKGPRLFGAAAPVVAPDLLVFGPRGTIWVEAKHKSVFTWHRKTQQWTTGIDLRHYTDYLAVQDSIELEVWLLFLHGCSVPAAIDRKFPSCPELCPVGLFGNSITRLRDCESHRSEKWARGMVYWSEQSLKRLASLEEVRAAAGGRKAD